MNEKYEYCPNCGQERIRSDGFKGFVSQFLNDYFTFDSKFIGSIRPLLFSPGHLTKEYLKGHRVKYIPPLRLFIFTSIIFFLLISWGSSSIVQAESIDQLQDERLWDEFFSKLLPRLFFFFLPLFAVFVSWLFGRKTDGFIAHFLFSAHFHSFIFFIGCLYWLTSKFLKSADMVQANAIVLLVFSAYVLLYLFLALRKVYARKLMPTIWRFLGLLFIYGISLTGVAVLAMFIRLQI